VCVPCPYDCLSCTVGGLCLTCDAADNRAFHSASSRCVALDGYFDNLTQICPLCPSGCSICSSPIHCTACTAGLFLVSNLCSGICPVRFVADPVLFVCAPCPYECYTCDLSGNCLSCNSTVDYRFSSNASAWCVALTGYFDNFTEIAVPCPFGCAECKSINFCTTCLIGYFFYQDGCHASCPARYFGNSRSLKCQPCPYDCLQCTSDGNCLSCNSSDFRLYSVPTQRCVPLDGYFDNVSSLAVACPLGCQVCKSLTLCTSCLDGYLLIIGDVCYSQCPPRYIISSQSKICEHCPYDCLSCDNSGLCLNCSEVIDFRMLNSATRRCVPLVGYF
jgi:proprotein convertase subtilisin/kexin type 5